MISLSQLFFPFSVFLLFFSICYNQFTQSDFSFFFHVSGIVWLRLLLFSLSPFVSINLTNISLSLSLSPFDTGWALPDEGEAVRLADGSYWVGIRAAPRAPARGTSRRRANVLPGRQRRRSGYSSPHNNRKKAFVACLIQGHTKNTHVVFINQSNYSFLAYSQKMISILK